MYYMEIAELLIRVENKFDYLKNVSEKYIVEPDRECDAYIAPTDEDIQFSLDWHLKYENEKVDPGYAEFTQAHQKLYAHIAKYDAFWMHAAVVGMDGYAYGFTGPSGYGKSTHAHLWKKAFGDKAEIINGDNPIIRKKGDKFYAYGTPFGGKHDENVNIGLPMKGYCFLQHGGSNRIEPLSPDEARNRILTEMFDFKIIKKNNFVKLLTLVEDFTRTVPMYTLICNMDVEAAYISHGGMQ